MRIRISIIKNFERKKVGEAGVLLKRFREKKFTWFDDWKFFSGKFFLMIFFVELEEIKEFFLEKSFLDFFEQKSLRRKITYNSQDFSSFFF